MTTQDFHLIVAIACGVIFYFLSCLWRPYRPCRRCNGSSKDPGLIFSKAFRPCRPCSGTGRRRRVGAWLMARGEVNPKSWKRAPKGSRWRGR